ncbi:hypothetical protein GCM10023237_58520 [Streptomyces coeruleoprunus]
MVPARYRCPFTGTGTGRGASGVGLLTRPCAGGSCRGAHSGQCRDLYRELYQVCAGTDAGRLRALSRVA